MHPKEGLNIKGKQMIISLNKVSLTLEGKILASEGRWGSKVMAMAERQQQQQQRELGLNDDDDDNIYRAPQGHTIEAQGWLGWPLMSHKNYPGG